MVTAVERMPWAVRSAADLPVGTGLRWPQFDPDAPTGRGHQVHDGQPSYQFWDKVAFDRIILDEDLLSRGQFGLLYHGSLALRSATSRRTVSRMRQSLQCPVFIDINIRQPHFDRDLAEQLLAGVAHLKLNDAELELLSNNGSGDCSGEISWDQRRRWAEELQQRHGLTNVWVTAGEQGAAWLGPEGQFVQVCQPPVAGLVDTVGAGDALAAVIIRGILLGLPADDVLPAAATFAGRVCTLRGAISDDPAFYRLDSGI